MGKKLAVNVKRGSMGRRRFLAVAGGTILVGLAATQVPRWLSKSAEDEYRAREAYFTELLEEAKADPSKR